MTTTLQAHGGGAQPASIDTSGKIAGGVALRVYGFDSAEDARAAGYICEGGPAMSVALITDAQIATGAWKAEGDPSALAVYTAPENLTIEGGFAVPVYPVNGWGSSTPAPVPPLFSSAEVGTVNALTVAVTFDQNVSAAGNDYSSGVTIKVNGSTRAFESGIRQIDNAIVYYALSLAVVNGDVVTWEYVEASGNIVARDDSTPLANVTAQSVTNNVAPAGDPIGDVLRAAAIAYWKADETPSGTRVDATGNGKDFKEVDDTIGVYNLGSVEAVAGKIGNAVKLQDNTAVAHNLYTDAFTPVDISGGLCLFGWLKFPQFQTDALEEFEFFKLLDPAEGGYTTQAGVAVGLIGPIGEAPMNMWDLHGSLFTGPLSVDTWHFFCYWGSGLGHHLQIDNGAIYDGTSTTDDFTITTVILGGQFYINNVDYILVDECGWLSIEPTQDQRDYLWNSGAGRALFPAP